MTSVPELVARLRAAGCVFAEDEARLLIAEACSPEELTALLERRLAGEPVEYVLGWAEFCGLRIAVAPGVFVPRRRTEYLVAQAAMLARRSSIVLDLCCGSGALGVALAAAVPGIELYASDIDSAAVACARRNLDPARVFCGDLFEPVPPGLRGRIDVLLANVPYVPTDAVATMPPEARDYEARIALDGGADGLDVLRRVAADTPAWLAHGGALLVETSAAQASEAARIMTRHNLMPRVASSEDVGATVVIGRRSATAW
jgi:release factor glutamine methyltransferase